MNDEKNPDAEATAAAKEAAEKAAEQAKEIATDAIQKVKKLDTPQLVYLIALCVVVLFTIVFDIASFSVGSSDRVYTETQAQAARENEAWLNSISYSAFASNMWGKLMWLAALAGIGIVIWSAVTNSYAAWIPLAQIGCAGAATLLLLLLFVTGFPDLSAFPETSSSATLFGYWIPLLAAGTATYFSVQRLLKA